MCIPVALVSPPPPPTPPPPHPTNLQLEVIETMGDVILRKLVESGGKVELQNPHARLGLIEEYSFEGVGVASGAPSRLRIGRLLSSGAGGKKTNNRKGEDTPQK